MQVNPALQRTLLEFLKARYPKPVLQVFEEEFSKEEGFWENAMYLHEHHLIDGKRKNSENGCWLSKMVITVQGLDFLEKDGGITGNKKTFTVKLDEENIRGLFEKRLIGSPIAADEKRTFLARLKDLPADVLSRLAMKALEKGMEHPDSLKALLEMLGGGGAPPAAGGFTV